MANYTVRGAIGNPLSPDILILLSTQRLYIDPTAKQAAFQKYFHYQPFRDDHKKHLEDTLRNRHLFFSDPHNVNDPWDCRPAFDYRPMLADPAKREEFLTFSRMFLGPDMLNHPLRPKYEHLIRTDDDQFIRAITESSRLLAENLALRRFYCLTPFADNTLMWSHYADNHRGICL